jgi:hypothetical protein
MLCLQKTLYAVFIGETVHSRIHPVMPLYRLDRTNRVVSAGLAVFHLFSTDILGDGHFSLNDNVNNLSFQSYHESFKVVTGE